MNNIVGKPIFDKGLFYIFKFIMEDSSRKESSLALEISIFWFCSFITEGAFTLEIEREGIKFFYMWRW